MIVVEFSPEPYMNTELSHIARAAAVGIGATLAMDAWNLFLKRQFGIPSLNYCLLGRWLSHIPAGRLRHQNIGAAPPKPRECLIGRVAHYGIGMTLGVAFVILVSGQWLDHPTLAPALLYGVATVIFPFCVMQPAFGLGIAASRTPNPAQARLKSLMTHTVFGLGLYACAVGASHLLRANT